MLTQVLNGGGASDNLHEGSTVNQQAVNDKVNNINEFLMGTSEAQNAESDDLDDFLANLVNQVRSFLLLFMHTICICPYFHCIPFHIFVQK